MNARNRVLASLGAMALMVSAVLPGFAEVVDTSTANVDVDVTGIDNGTVSVVIMVSTEDPFTNVTYNYTNAVDSTGVLIVNATDNRGTAAGWNIKLKGTDFVQQVSTTVGGNIAIGQLGLIPGSPELNSATGVIPTSTSPITIVSGTAQPLWNAAVGEGNGEFELPVDGTLAVPAGTLVDTYKSTITVEIDNAPYGLRLTWKSSPATRAWMAPTPIRNHSKEGT